MSLAKEMSERLRANEPEPVVSDSAEIETPFFGIEPSQRFPTTIDLRLADGNFKAIPYTYISEIDFKPSEGIEITASGRRILITGRNLRRLYNYLVTYRVRFIQANIGADIDEGNDTFVSSISIDPLPF